MEQGLVGEGDGVAVGVGVGVGVAVGDGDGGGIETACVVVLSPHGLLKVRVIVNAEAEPYVYDVCLPTLGGKSTTPSPQSQS